MTIIPRFPMDPGSPLMASQEPQLSVIQREARKWRKKNFPDQTKLEAALGVAEETGELAHAVLKDHQGIRGTTDEHVAKVSDALGDIVIFAMGLADHYHLDLQQCVEVAWAEVSQRDWTKNPETGVTPERFHIVSVNGYLTPMSLQGEFVTEELAQKQIEQRLGQGHWDNWKVVPVADQE